MFRLIKNTRTLHTSHKRFIKQNTISRHRVLLNKPKIKPPMKSIWNSRCIFIGPMRLTPKEFCHTAKKTIPVITYVSVVSLIILAPYIIPADDK